MVRSPNRVLTPLKSVSKIRISSFVTVLFLLPKSSFGRDKILNNVNTTQLLNLVRTFRSCVLHWSKIN